MILTLFLETFVYIVQKNKPTHNENMHFKIFPKYVENYKSVSYLYRPSSTKSSVLETCKIQLENDFFKKSFVYSLYFYSDFFSLKDVLKLLCFSVIMKRKTSLHSTTQRS